MDANPKTLVVMPAEKFRESKCNQWKIGNTAFTDWDSLNKGGYSQLARYQLVIACGYFADVVQSGTNAGWGPIWGALPSYLQGEGSVVFLLPTSKGLPRGPYPHQLKEYPGVTNKREWNKEREQMWKSEFLAATLELIKRCIKADSVLFKPLDLQQGIDYKPAGNAASFLRKYLDQFAPKNPPYAISAEGVDTVPLAQYTHNREMCAAIKVVTRQGGISILLPFDAENLVKKDVELLISLYVALGVIRVYAYFGSQQNLYQDNKFWVEGAPETRAVNLSRNQLRVVQAFYEASCLSQGSSQHLHYNRLENRLREEEVNLPREVHAVLKAIDNLILQINRMFKRHRILPDADLLEKVPGFTRVRRINPAVALVVKTSL